MDDTTVQLLLGLSLTYCLEQQTSSSGQIEARSEQTRERSGAKKEEAGLHICSVLSAHHTSPVHVHPVTLSVGVT